MDFPADIAAGQPFGSLGPWEPTSMWGGLNAGNFTSHAWPTASLAMISEVFLPTPATLRGFAWSNAGTVSGNVDCGLYDLKGNQIAHTGSTAQAGANAVQAVSVGATVLKPGNYYVAIVMDNTTGTLLMQGGNTGGWYVWFPALGVFSMGSAFPLPSTLVPAVAAQNWLPLFSALINASVV